VVGVVSAPALHTRWWAGKGLGAFRNGQRISVSSVAALDDAQLSLAWDTKERYDADGIATRCWRSRTVVGHPRSR